MLVSTTDKDLQLAIYDTRLSEVDQLFQVIDLGIKTTNVTTAQLASQLLGDIEFVVVLINGQITLYRVPLGPELTVEPVYTNSLYYATKSVQAIYKSWDGKSTDSNVYSF